MQRFTAFVDKAKSKLNNGSSFPGHTPQQPLLHTQPDRPSSIQPPTQADVQRYRYHHGTNLGTIFILERWLCGSMFPDGSEGSSELAAAQAWMSQEGLDATRSRFEKHWAQYVSDTDIDWLRDVAKCTTVRLPIGHFTLGPPYCEGTAFASVSGVYQNAWTAVKALVDRLHQRGVGTLIDLHGLPGGANGQEHSGTNSGKAEFWGNNSHQDLATRCLLFIAQQVKSTPGVVGIQLVNEVDHGSHGMYEWYDRVLNELRQVDLTMPIYISDAWDMSRAVSWSQSKNAASVTQANPVVVDTHLYWAFSDEDKRKTPQQITSEVSDKFNDLHGKEGHVIDHGAGQIIVGEYSCVLTEDSWSKADGTAKDELVKNFGNVQSDVHQQRAGGSFFWTYRMDWMDGGEWGFKQMTESSAIKPPLTLTFPQTEVQSRISSAQARQQEQRGQTVSGHIGWWDSNHPGNYEHWRFEQGWDVGFNDALHFFGQRREQGLDGGDKIGMLDLWVLKRIRDSGQGGSFVWEFEQGLRQGIRDFYSLIGV